LLSLWQAVLWRYGFHAQLLVVDELIKWELDILLAVERVRVDVGYPYFILTEDEFLLVLSKPTFGELVDYFDGHGVEIVMDGDVKLLSKLEGENLLGDCPIIIGFVKVKH